MQAHMPLTITEASTLDTRVREDPLVDRMVLIETNMANLNVDLTNWMEEVRQLIKNDQVTTSQGQASPGSHPKHLGQANHASH